MNRYQALAETWLDKAAIAHERARQIERGVAKKMLWEHSDLDEIDAEHLRTFANVTVIQARQLIATVKLCKRKKKESQ